MDKTTEHADEVRYALRNPRWLIEFGLCEPEPDYDPRFFYEILNPLNNMHVADAIKFAGELFNAEHPEIAQECGVGECVELK